MALDLHVGQGKDISDLDDFPIEDLVGQPDATAFLPEMHSIDEVNPTAGSP